MKRRKPKLRSKWHRNNYAARVIQTRPKKPGIYKTSIFHDSWCRKLRDGGLCDCDPDVKTEPIETLEQFKPSYLKYERELKYFLKHFAPQAPTEYN